MRKSLVLSLGLLAALPGRAGAADGNMGTRPFAGPAPFTLERQATLDLPWAIAPLPGGDLLVSGKTGRMWRIGAAGGRELGNVPEVQYSGQNGLLDVALSPDFGKTGRIYFTYVSPDDALVLARARLGADALEAVEVLWRQSPGGRGQPGGIIAFGPDGMLYLSVGDRMQPDTAQDPDNPRGKILRLTPEGRPAPGNPFADSPFARGTTRAETWTTGHRNAYGLAFAPDGRLWSHEMGPRGGDELNLIAPGRNYGWPMVSNGDNYSGIPIPDHATRPEFAAPALWWDPVIAPAGLVFVPPGGDFPDWAGSMLIGALAGQGLVRVAGDGSDQIERWDLEMRVRDVAIDGAGAIWIVEDSDAGGLYRLVPR